jgi:hypothetical protein
MKKAIILVFSLLITSVMVNAQGHKMWISGQAAFSSSSSTPQGGDKTKSSEGKFGPVFGYNVNDMITVGIGLLYSSNITDPPGASKTTTTAFNVMPFARYNHKAGDKLTVYGEFDLSIGSGKTKSENQFGSGESKNSSLGISVGPGLDYMLSDRFSISAMWGALNYNSIDNKDVNKSSSFGLGLDLSSVSFALNYHFGK